MFAHMCKDLYNVKSLISDSISVKAQVMIALANLEERRARRVRVLHVANPGVPEVRTPDDRSS